MPFSFYEEKFCKCRNSICLNSLEKRKSLTFNVACSRILKSSFPFFIFCFLRPPSSAAAAEDIERRPCWIVCSPDEIHPCFAFLTVRDLKECVPEGLVEQVRSFIAHFLGLGFCASIHSIGELSAGLAALLG